MPTVVQLEVPPPDPVPATADGQLQLQLQLKGRTQLQLCSWQLRTCACFGPLARCPRQGAARPRTGGRDGREGLVHQAGPDHHPEPPVLNHRLVGLLAAGTRRALECGLWIRSGSSTLGSQQRSRARQLTTSRRHRGRRGGLWSIMIALCSPAPIRRPNAHESRPVARWRRGRIGLEDGMLNKCCSAARRGGGGGPTCVCVWESETEVTLVTWLGYVPERYVPELRAAGCGLWVWTVDWGVEAQDSPKAERTFPLLLPVGR